MQYFDKFCQPFKIFHSQLTVLAMVSGEVAGNGGDEDEEEKRLRDENNNDWERIEEKISDEEKMKEKSRNSDLIESKMAAVELKGLSVRKWLELLLQRVIVVILQSSARVLAAGIDGGGGIGR